MTSATAPRRRSSRASVTDFWAKLIQDPNTAVSKVIRIKYTVEGQPEQKTYSLYLAYAADEE
jgi:hypothetical protein